MNRTKPTTTTLDTATVRRWKRYPEYRPAGLDWLAELPAHWQILTLKRRARIRYGLGQPPEPMPEGLPLIRATNVKRGRIADEGMMYIDPADVPASRDAVLRTGDIIVVRSGAYTGDSAIIPQEYAGAIAGYDMVVRSSKDHSPYLSWQFLSPEVEDYQFQLVKLRAAQPHLNAEELGETVVCVPPFPEQQAIAAFLDRETTRIDALVGAKERLIALLEEKRQAVISHAVTRGLDPAAPLKDSGIPWLEMVPKHWEVKKLKYSVHFLNYRRIPLSAEERGGLEKIYPYYGASGIIDQVDRYLFDEPLILLGEDGANLLSRSTPLAFIATGKYWVNNHAHILKPKWGHLVYWAERLNSISYEPFISGSAQPKLTIDALASIEFATPNAQEQAKIAQYIQEHDAELGPVMSRVRDGIARLQEYRAALISAAVTGQIDVRGEV